MANAKITDLTELTTPASGDWFPIVDVSDTTQASSGTTKKVNHTNLGYAPTASPTFTGTVTLPSGTVLTAPTITTSIVPTTDDGAALGSTANKFADLFLASGAVINWNSGNVALTHTAGILTLGTGEFRITTVGTNTASVPTIGSTNTLTNKRITKRTGTTTSHATPTINTDNVDFYSITAQTEAITSFTTNLSGTPTEAQTLWIAITGTAARAITWGASFEASTVALPTTTVSTSRLDVGFVWNTVTSKWRCVATS